MSEEDYIAPPVAQVLQWVEDFKAASASQQIDIVKTVVNAHNILEVEYGHSSTHMFRVRKIDVKNLPADYSGVIWPPKSAVTPGRVTSTDHPVLYLSRHGFTAFSETDVVNDDVIIAHYKIRPGQSLRIAPVGEYERLSRSGISEFISANEPRRAVMEMLKSLGAEAIKSILLMDSFLFDCVVDHKDNYRLSAEVAKSIFRKHPQADAIAYASVKQRNGMNIAVRTSRVWPTIGLVGVRHTRVRHLGYGVYDLGEGFVVTEIDSKGKFTWNDALVPDNVMVEWEPWTPSA